MKTLKATLEALLEQTGFNKIIDFASGKKIQYKEGDKSFLHTFNYLDQKFNELTFLEINPTCEAFNMHFWDVDASDLNPDYWHWLLQNGFGQYSPNTLLQPFDNLMLEMDFLPKIKGYFIRDTEGNYYMLVSFAKYNSDAFTSLKLFKYTREGFSFPMQSNYIKD